MHAAQISTYGPAENINIATEVPVPTPQEGQVLIEVKAVSLNPVDSMVRNGFLQKMAPLALPATLGGDVAGVVSEVGVGVTDFAVGDQVYGQASLLMGGSGSLAEYATASVHTISHMPEQASFAEAATAPLVGASVIQALTEHIQLKAGQKLLILGGVGSIGSLAIQGAKHLGAQVTAVVRDQSDISFAKELGADQVALSAEAAYGDQLVGFNAVFDTVGGPDAAKSYAALKAGGTFVSMAGAASDELAEQYKVTAINQMTSVTTEKLTILTKLIDNGVLQLRVAQTFPLSQTVEAFQAREQGSLHGKVVVTIK